MTYKPPYVTDYRSGPEVDYVDIGGGGGGAGAGLTKEETVNVATASSGPNLTITTIDGESIGNFDLVLAYFDQVVFSASDTGRLRLSGRSGTSEYRVGGLNATNGAPADQAFLPALQEGSGANQEGALEIWHIRSVAPTVVKCVDLYAGSTNNKRYGCFAQTAAAETSLDFYTAGGSNWNSGTLYLMGVKFRSVTVQSHTWAGEGSVTFDLGANDVCCGLILDTVHAASQFSITLGTGGVFKTGGTDYRGMYMNQFSDGSADRGDFELTEFNTANGCGIGQFFGLNSADVPIWYNGFALNNGGTSVEMNGNMQVGAMGAYDQIKVALGAGTVTSGTAYCVSYQGVLSVEEHEFTVAAANHEFLNISDPIVGFIADTLTLTASGAIRSYTSIDNCATLDNGASDYIYSGMDAGFDQVALVSNLELSPRQATTKNVISTGYGFGGVSRPVWFLQETGARQASPIVNAGVRDDPGAYNSFHIYNDGAGNFSAGRLFRAAITP